MPRTEYKGVEKIEIVTSEMFHRGFLIAVFQLEVKKQKQCCSKLELGSCPQ